MSKRMVRKQIYLPRRQDQALKHMARERGVSEAEVIRQALEVLKTAQTPGEIVHSPEIWPVPEAEARKAWQPKEPSPIITELSPRFLQIVRKQRGG